MYIGNQEEDKKRMENEMGWQGKGWKGENGRNRWQSWENARIRNRR